MAKPLVRLVRVNGLQFNANRDPQAYRRVVGEAFQVQALLEGRGEARCALLDERGETLASSRVERPGTYSAALTFDAPGSRVVTLHIEAPETQYSQTLRLDVMKHAWQG